MVLNAAKDQAADDPPYSRLFVVYNKKEQLTEAEIRADFSPYGDVQDIFIVKDRTSGEQKGKQIINCKFHITTLYSLLKIIHLDILRRSCLCEIFQNVRSGSCNGKFK